MCVSQQPPGNTLDLSLQEPVLKNTECFGSSPIPITAIAPHTSYSYYGETSSICKPLTLSGDPMQSVCQNKLVNYLQGHKAPHFAV